MKEYQRYLRLQHLLEKSSIYSKFLLERMENQMEEKKVCVCMLEWIRSYATLYLIGQKSCDHQ